MTRTLIAVCGGVAIIAAACSGGSPTSPSAAGATIAGTIVGGGQPAAVAAPPAMTVSVAGTALSTGVDAGGGFRLGGVPEGDVQLAFSGPGTASSITLPNVAREEIIELQVAIVGGTATVLNEVRGNGQGKVVLCHRSDNGYHTIEVSVNAEPAHRGHGDAKPGEPVPADPSKVFDATCQQISPVSIKKFTNEQDADQAPGPTIPVGAPVRWTYLVTNNSALTLNSLSITDDRGVAVACPNLLPPPGASITCSGSGVAAAGQYRNVGTVTATANGIQYTASDVSHYFGGTRVVTLKKFTNGEDVTQAPGPSIPVGSPVTWTYVVTNTSTLTFSGLSLIDDKGVAVACPNSLPPPGASITCHGSGTAVAGQYRNIATVTVSANGTQYTDRDDSFYFGVDANETSKVQLCHRTGNGSYHMIEVSVNAERAHRAHGDGKVGEEVPGNPGRVFTASCGIR